MSVSVFPDAMRLVDLAPYGTLGAAICNPTYTSYRSSPKSIIITVVFCKWRSAELRTYLDHQVCSQLIRMHQLTGIHYTTLHKASHSQTHGFS